MTSAPGRGLDRDDPEPAGAKTDTCQDALEQTKTELELVNEQLETDLQARRRQERELELLHDLAEKISSARNLETALEAVLDRICEGSEFSIGEAWLPTGEGNQLALGATVSRTEPPEGWDQASQDLRLEPGDGLPGEAWERDGVVWAKDIGEDGTLPRSTPARQAGLRAGVAIPISGEDGVEAVLMFVVDEPRARDRRFVRMVSTIAHSLASWIHRRRLQDRLRERTRELEATNRELKEFAEAAAHDLQEPLRDVVRYVQRIENRLEDDLGEESHQDMTYAVSGAKRLHDLLNDLLRYSEAGDHPAREERTDARAALDAVLERLSSEIDAAGAEVTVGELPELPLGRPELETLLEELIDNALTYNDAETPEIEVSARRTDEAWLITVEDNGVGIPSPYQNTVFDLFERLDRDGPPGAGVGLSLCRRIAERHGGHILLASEPGEGTTVTVRLPDEG